MVDRQLDAQHTLRGDVQSTAQGYLSLGFSYNSRISNADTYTGWVEARSGTVILFDEWSPNYNKPYQDTSRGGSSDITDVAGKQRQRRADHFVYAPTQGNRRSQDCCQGHG